MWNSCVTGVLRAPDSSCGSAHRVTLSALGQGRGAVPESHLGSDWPWNHKNALLLSCQPAGPSACPRFASADGQCLNGVTRSGETAVTSASTELLLTAEKLDTEHSKKVTAGLSKSPCFCSLKNCSFFDCRFSKNQWLIQAVSQKEKWGWSLLTGRNSSCQIQSYWSEYLPEVLHFPFHYSVIPFPREFAGFTVSILSLLMISCACLHSEQLNAVRVLQLENKREGEIKSKNRCTFGVIP